MPEVARFTSVVSCTLQKIFWWFGLRRLGHVVLDTSPLVDLLLQLVVEVLHVGRNPPLALLFVLYSVLLAVVVRVVIVESYNIQSDMMPSVIW